MTSKKERQNEIEKYVSYKCSVCESCKWNSKNMELYKLNLPNGVINIVREMAYEPCKHCKSAREIKCRNERIFNYNADMPNFTINTVELSYFLSFYTLPSYEKLKEHFTVSKLKYNLYGSLFSWYLGRLHERDIKTMIINSGYDLKRTINQINKILRWVYDNNHQEKIYDSDKNTPYIFKLDYCPELK